MKYLIFILLSFLSFNAIAQNQSDSLESLIENTTNWNNKAQLAYEFAKINLTSNLEKCLAIYSNVQQNQHLITDSTQLFNLYNIKGVIYQYRHEIDTSNYYFDNALQIAEATNDSVLMLKVLGNLGINYTETGEYQKSVNTVLKTLEYYRKRKDTGSIARAYLVITNNYAYMKNYPEAMRNAKKFLFYFKAANAKLG